MKRSWQLVAVAGCTILLSLGTAAIANLPEKGGPKNDVVYLGQRELALNSPGAEETLRKYEGVVYFTGLDQRKQLSNLIDPSKALLIWGRSNDWSQASSMLEKKPLKISVFQAVPTTSDAIRKVYGTSLPASADLLGSLKNAADEVEHNCGTFLLMHTHWDYIDLIRKSKASKPGGDTQAESLRQHIAKQDSDSLAIIPGHIDGQGYLHLPDGSAVAIKDLKGPGLTWIIGCDTVKHLDVSTGLSVVTTGKPQLVDTLKTVDSFIKGFSDNDSFYETLKKTTRKQQVLVPTAGVFVTLPSELPA